MSISHAGPFQIVAEEAHEENRALCLLTEGTLAARILALRLRRPAK